MRLSTHGAQETVNYLGLYPKALSSLSLERQSLSTLTKVSR